MWQRMRNVDVVVYEECGVWQCKRNVDVAVKEECGCGSVGGMWIVCEECGCLV